MQEHEVQLQSVEVESLGERLSCLRLRDADALAAMRRSIEQYGQLSALTLFRAGGDTLEIIDGFKRVRAARVLGLRTLLARVESLDPVQAKLRLRALQQGSGLTELEEGWLVRSLYRDDRLTLPEIAQQLHRHKSWVWRRLMLVEALESDLQADVRLGLLAPRSASALSRLPRGNQRAASEVVMRHGFTVRQTERLVDEALAEEDDAARAALLARRLTEVDVSKRPGPRPMRRVRNEAEWMSADILKLHEVAARMTARLYSTPFEAFTADSAALLRDALVRLSPVLRALDDIIDAVARKRVV
jgi:ParB-like chromosome segregation protein Spo0J